MAASERIRPAVFGYAFLTYINYSTVGPVRTRLAESSAEDCAPSLSHGPRTLVQFEAPDAGELQKRKPHKSRIIQQIPGTQASRLLANTED